MVPALRGFGWMGSNWAEIGHSMMKRHDESYIFTGGNKDKNVIAETQLEFDDRDIALSGNVNGIGNIQPFTIPETQKTRVIYMT